MATKKARSKNCAQRVIDKGLELLSKRMDIALEHEDELERILQELEGLDKDELSTALKKTIITNISALELQKLGDITDAIDAVYDKHLQAESKGGGFEVSIKVIE